MSRKEIYKEVSHMMKEQRNKEELSQTEIAENFGVGMSQQTIGRYENHPKYLLTDLEKGRRVLFAYNFNESRIDEIIRFLLSDQLGYSVGKSGARSVEQAKSDLESEFPSAKDILKLSKLLMQSVEERL